MFHKVLVATGGSRWSQQAVEYAVGLAKDYALEFVVLSVVTDTPLILSLRLECHSKRYWQTAKGRAATSSWKRRSRPAKPVWHILRS